MISRRTIDGLSPYLLPFFTLQYPTSTPSDPDSFPDSAYYTTGASDFCLIISIIAVMAALRDACRLGLFEPFARWILLRKWELQAQLRIGDEAKDAPCANDGSGHASGNGLAKGIGHDNGSCNGHNGYGSRNGLANGNGFTTGGPSRKELRKMHRSVLRFAEQGWSAIYYTLQWSYGLYIHRSLPTRIFDPVDLWQGYPHTPIAGPLKFYFMTQIAFYFHQVLILNAEERRKDHLQMFTHHVITLTLMVLSFFSNFTRVACLIMVLMDWCDIFLALAKMIRYVQISQLACDITFAWFLVSWFVTRHILFVLVIKSAIMDVPVYIPFDVRPEDGYYLSREAYLLFMTMLVALQILQIIWFWMICRVAWQVINGRGASDDRSDEEGDGEMDDKEK